jgi:hypothetical protein
MRLDTDIKADIIAELEEVHDARHGMNLLDALMVESVQVRDGEAQVTLVYEDDRTADERSDIETQIRELTSDVDGLGALHFENMTATELRRMDPLAWVPGQQPVSPQPTSPTPAATPATLTLGALMAKAEEDATAEEDADGINLYAGGGCAAGTKSLPQPDPVAQRGQPLSPTPSTAVLADGMVSLTAIEFANLVAENRVLKERLRVVSRLLRTVADDIEI